MKLLKVLLLCSGILLTNNINAKPRSCEVNYQLDNAGTITTGWINLGNVSGFLANKKKKCKQLAIKHCAKAKRKLLDYAPVGSPNMKSICNQGKLSVYFDTKVEGKLIQKTVGVVRL